MIFTAQDKFTPLYTTLIKRHRKKLKLSQKAYGAYFNVSGTAVSKWESGQSEAPYIVTWVIYKSGLMK